MFARCKGWVADKGPCIVNVTLGAKDDAYSNIHTQLCSNSLVPIVVSFPRRTFRQRIWATHLGKTLPCELETRSKALAK